MAGTHDWYLKERGREGERVGGKGERGGEGEGEEGREGRVEQDCVKSLTTQAVYSLQCVSNWVHAQ